MRPLILLTCKSLLPFIGIVGLLNGCGGGGGSKDNVSIPFTSWSDINPPATVFANGISEDADYVAPAPDHTVTELIELGFSTDSNASIIYREDRAISRISITTPNGTAYGLQYGVNATKAFTGDASLVGLVNVNFRIFKETISISG